MSIFSEAVTSLSTSGGCTIRPDAKAPNSGYAVSVYPEYTRSFSLDGVTPTALQERIEQYARTTSDLLKSPNNYIGLWLDTETGLVYLDVSTVVDTLWEAFRLAKQYKQLAIYDFFWGREIRIPPEAVYPA